MKIRLDETNNLENARVSFDATEGLVATFSRRRVTGDVEHDVVITDAPSVLFAARDEPVGADLFSSGKAKKPSHVGVADAPLNLNADGVDTCPRWLAPREVQDVFAELATTSDSNASNVPDNLPNCAVLSETPKIWLYWGVNEADATIDFKLVSARLGYVSVGIFSGIKAHSFVLSDQWTVVGPSPYCPHGCIEDTYLPTTGDHNMYKDATSNLELAEVAVSGDEMTAKWRRALVTSDAVEDMAISLTSEHNLAWAFYAANLTTSYKRHDFREIRKINFGAATSECAQPQPPVNMDVTPLPNCMLLHDENQKLYFSWKVEAGIATMELRTDALGYVAVTFSDNTTGVFHTNLYDAFVCFPPGSLKCAGGCIEDAYSNARCLGLDVDRTSIHHPFITKIDGLTVYRWHRPVAASDPDGLDLSLTGKMTLSWALYNKTMTTYRAPTHTSYGYVADFDWGAAASGNCPTFAVPQYPNCAVLSATPKVWLKWGQNEAGKIDFELESKRLGYVSVGLFEGIKAHSTLGLISDLWTVVAPSKHCADGCVEDTYLPASGDHSMGKDATSNLDLTSVTVSGDEMTARWRRELVAADTAEDMDISVTSEQNVAWAFYIANLSSSSYARHDFRGIRRINFGEATNECVQPSEEPPADLSPLPNCVRLFNEQQQLYFSWKIVAGVATLEMRTNVLGYAAVTFSDNTTSVFHKNFYDAYVGFPPGSLKCADGCIEDAYSFGRCVSLDVDTGAVQDPVVATVDGLTVYRWTRPVAASDPDSLDLPLTGMQTLSFALYNKTMTTYRASTHTSYGYVDFDWSVAKFENCPVFPSPKESSSDEDTIASSAPAAAAFGGALLLALALSA